MAMKIVMDTATYSLFGGSRHARYINADVTYHVTSRVFQGRFLLTPDDELNQLILGIIGRAQFLYPTMRLHGFTFMSNHFHAIATGPSSQLPDFFGYIKREISRRHGARQDVDWQGTMWEEYTSTALPTFESQVECMRYVMGQGTADNLVERPQDWPGAHSINALMLGDRLSGRWLDATAFLRARQRATRRKKPVSVDRDKFFTTYEIRLTPLPAWAGLGETALKQAAADLVDDILQQALAERAAAKTKALGVNEVKQIPRDRRTQLPTQEAPRGRMIFWANPNAPEVQAYLELYWSFQMAYKAASRRFRNGELDVVFPTGSFRPTAYQAPKATEHTTSIPGE